MENIVSVNQRAMYKYNQVVDIGAGANKVYNFVLSSRQTFRLIWVFCSHNLIRGELLWGLALANYKIDDVAMSAADQWMGFGNFYNVFNQLYLGLGSIPAEFQSTMSFDLRITNDDVILRSSDVTLWFILMSNDNATITAEVTIT